jgi:hypothetical protein
MSDLLYGAESGRGLAKEYQRSPSARPNTNSRGNFRAGSQVGLIALVGLFGLAFCAACASLFLGNSRFFATEPIAIEASEKAMLVVKRSHKADRLPMGVADSWTHPGDTQDGFATPVPGDPPNGRRTIRDGTGRLLFELDPLRRTTVISKTQGS